MHNKSKLMFIVSASKTIIKIPCGYIKNGKVLNVQTLNRQCSNLLHTFSLNLMLTSIDCPTITKP